MNVLLSFADQLKSILRLKYNKNNENIKFSSFLLTIYHKNNKNIKFSLFLLKKTTTSSFLFIKMMEILYLHHFYILWNKNDENFIFSLFLFSSAVFKHTHFQHLVCIFMTSPIFSHWIRRRIIW